MGKRRDGLLVGVGTGALLLSALGAGLALGVHRAKPQANRPQATASPTAAALASPSALISALPSLLPSPAASLLPSPPAPPHTPAPTRRPAPPPPPPFSGSWPDYRSGADQSGWNGAENQLDASAARRLAVRWSFGGGYEPPVIAEGNLYVAAPSEVDVMPAGGCGQQSCTAAWRADLGTGSQIPNTPAGAPAIDGGGLFVSVNVGSQPIGWVYGFRAGGCGASKCEPVWKQQIGTNTSSGPGSNGQVWGGPVAAGGLVYAAATNAGPLYAFDGSTGAVVWKGTMAGGSLSTSPAVADGIVYVDSSGVLTAFTASGCGAATCSPLWTAPVSAASTPGVSGGRVFVEDGGGTVRAFDAHTGAALWSTATGAGNSHASPLAAPNVVVAPGSNSLLVLDPASGTVLWTVPVGASVASASPTGGDGVGYVLGNDDRLYAFTTSPCGAATCAPIWSTSVGASNAGGSGYDGPVVAGGRLFVHAADGTTVSLSPS